VDVGEGAVQPAALTQPDDLAAACMRYVCVEVRQQGIGGLMNMFEGMGAVCSVALALFAWCASRTCIKELALLR
jgi:hypothetical protein